MSKAEEIADRLDAYCPKEIRFLNEREPFRFLVCVVLSAQTTDQTVNSVVPALWKKYPTRQDLASASQIEVEEIIHATGFYHSKAKHIIALAASLIGKEIPTSIEELVKLPGVGRKTANCYIGDILHGPAIIVDTHFGRVVKRLGLVSSSEPAVVEKQLKKVLPLEKQYRFSMSANWFGRQVCHARKPECDRCPLSGSCPSRADADQATSRL